MKPYPLPPINLGLDVVSEEGDLPAGAVRRANNVVLTDEGGFRMRPGYRVHIDLPFTKSFWRSTAQTRVLTSVDDTLYDVDLDAAATAVLLTGLTPGEPVSYQDVGTDIYLTSPGVYRKITIEGDVRIPGVCPRQGPPTLASTVGGMIPGRYGVAYSLLVGEEESPISGIAWIDLTEGGILVTGIQDAPNVTRVRLYLTEPDGEDLYHHATRPHGETQSMTDGTRKKMADRMNLEQMPSGSMVRHYNGRNYVVRGNLIYPSQKWDYGVYDGRAGPIDIGRKIKTIEPVVSGIFVGLSDSTLFLNGAHEEMGRRVASQHGAFRNSSKKASPKFFSGELVPDRNNPVAVWLSEVGLAIGRADGSIAYPQLDRVRLDGGVSWPLLAQFGGTKQVIFCVQSLATNGATDRTI